MLHFLSAGAASFARGLNDTPKMVALLLVANAFHLRWGLLAVAVMIAVGALLGIGITTRQAHWRKVGEILLAWLITLPCAALLAALVFLVTK